MPPEQCPEIPSWVADCVRAILVREKCVKRLLATPGKDRLAAEEHFGIGLMLRNLYLWANKDIKNPDCAWLVPAEIAWDVVRGKSLAEAYRLQVQASAETRRRLLTWLSERGVSVADIPSRRPSPPGRLGLP